MTAMASQRFLQKVPDFSQHSSEVYNSSVHPGNNITLEKNHQVNISIEEKHRSRQSGSHGFLAKKTGIAKTVSLQ